MKGTVRSEWNVGGLGTELLAVGLVIPVMISVLAPIPSDLAADSGWGPRILVTDDNANNTLSSYSSAVTTDVFGNVYVVWEEVSELDGSGPDTDIFLRKFNASTLMWEPRILITDDNANNTEHSAAPDAETDVFGNVHVIWYDKSYVDEMGFVGYQWKMWNATTKEWGKRVQFTSVGPPGQVGYASNIVSDSLGNLHVTWRKVCQPDAGIPTVMQYRKWNGTSQSWEDWMPVTTNLSVAPLTRLAADPAGNVHVVWMDQTSYGGAIKNGTDYDLYYRKLNAGTNTWGTIIQLNDDDRKNHDGSILGDMVSDSSGNLHVVWHESQDQADLGYGLDTDIFYKKWNAIAGIWEPRQVVSDDPDDTADSARSKIAVDLEGNLHVVWVDGSDVDGAGLTNGDIFYRKWSAANGTWEKTISLTNDLNDQYLADRPDIASDRYGNLAVVWEDMSGLVGSGWDNDIYMRRFTFPLEALRATVDCDPDTLNLKSQGRWMTCYIELPSGYDPRDIDASTILLNDVLPPELDPKYGFVRSEDSYITDHDGDGVPERMVKFDRSAVQNMLSPGESVMLTITGKLFDGTEFEGTDVIRVIDPVQSSHSTGPIPPRQVRSESPIEFLERLRGHRTMADLI